MWDTVDNPDNLETPSLTMSHFLTCPRCGHEVHTFLACSDTCACAPVVMPGSVPLVA